MAGSLRGGAGARGGAQTSPCPSADLGLRHRRRRACLTRCWREAPIGIRAFRAAFALTAGKSTTPQGASMAPRKIFRAAAVGRLWHPRSRSGPSRHPQGPRWKSSPPFYEADQVVVRPGRGFRARPRSWSGPGPGPGGTLGAVLVPSRGQRGRSTGSCSHRRSSGPAGSFPKRHPAPARKNGYGDGPGRARRRVWFGRTRIGEGGIIPRGLSRVAGMGINRAVRRGVPGPRLGWTP